VFEFIENLIVSGTSGSTDFFGTMLSAYLKLNNCSKGLLLSKDNESKPYIIISSGIEGDKENSFAEFYIENYYRIFNELSVNKSDDFNYAFVNDDTMLHIALRCNFEGLIILIDCNRDRGFFKNENLESFTRIVIRLINAYQERCKTDDLLTIYKEECLRKGRYLSGFAHEMKTPMNTITGFSQLLKEPDLKKENILKFIKIISDTSENIISSINSFNEIAEIETGQIKIYADTIHIPALLDEIYSKYYSKFKQKDLVLEKNIFQGETFSDVFTDEAKLKQVFDILILNSLENTFTGKVTFNCRFCNEYTVFSISDTGTGISPEKKKALFNFQTVHSSFVQNSKRPGLGLIIAKSYVEIMGGKFWFESQEGKGTEFFFTIPYSHVPEDPNKKKSYTKNKFRVINTSRKKILVAEDDNLNFYLISNFLSGLNVEIIRAENGGQAVDIFKSEVIDLILMDIRMPVMDGFTAARLIREISRDVKIIAQTAYSNDKSIAVSNGCNDFIAKPFSKNQLLSLVSYYL
jgi:signal transduction histidine kinase